MQLSTRDGIKCDTCGATHKTQFTYYSVDISSVQHTQYGTAKSNDTILSYDLCPLCFSKYCELVKKHYKPVRTGIVCDLTGAYVKGMATTYYAVIAKIDVKVPTVSIDHRHLELNLCEQAYTEIKNKIDHMRSTSEWTTNNG